MFSKFFSSSQSKPVPEDIQGKITQFFASYSSELFPSGMAKDCQILSVTQSQDDIQLTIKAPFACESELNRFAEALLANTAISVLIDYQLDIAPVKRHNIAGVKNIIAISSGKGGVGKSTTTVNLAYALQAEGASVGILDADIYGPSIPKMLGLQGQRVTSTDGKVMQPLGANGIEAMSIGLLVDENDATVWRGPMASRAFNQMLNETAWHDVDYLLIDMPPGTGDIQLTLAQQVPVAGAVVITTPQDIALIDALKGIEMFNKVNVSVLGVVENMSYHICQNCGDKAHIFGQGAAEALKEKYQIEVLGQLPLDITICQDADKGNSPLIENSASDIAMHYRRIAGKIAAELYHHRDAHSPDSNEIFIKQVD